MGEQQTRIAVARWDEIAWEPMRPGVDRKVFSGQGATLQLSRLRPGHAVRPHEHPYEQIVYIISGGAEFHVGDKVFLLTGGDCLAIPPNVQHYAVVVGNHNVLNLDVFIPRRADIAG